MLDLGSGSGTDSFIAAKLVGPDGCVIGVDMTDAQVAKARHFGAKISQATFVEGVIEAPPVGDDCFDVVISNGVINLAPDKEQVFRAAAAALRPGGRLALADIVSTREAQAGPHAATSRCGRRAVGGAVPQDDYVAAIEAAGLEVKRVRANPGLPLPLAARAGGGGSLRRLERVDPGRQALSGSAAVTTVPRPGGLMTASVPPAASARSRKPMMPLPVTASAPPRPSSAISQRSMSPSRASGDAARRRRSRA